MTRMTEDQEAELIAPDLSGQFEEARKKKNLTVDVVSHQLKVSRSRVLAIETGCYEDMPGSTFTKGLIRSYCRLLEIDPAPFLAHYQEFWAECEKKKTRLHPVLTTEKKPSLFFLVLRSFLDSWPIFRNPWFLFSTLFFVIVFVVSFSRWLWVWTHKDSVVLPKPAISLIDSGHAVLTPPRIDVGKLDVRVSQPTWLVVHDQSGHLVFSKDVVPNKVYHVSSVPPLSVMVGNLSVTHFTYNGRPLLSPQHVTQDAASHYSQFYLT